MENQVVKNLSYEKTGKRIIEYFKSLGVDTRGFIGTSSEERGYEFHYYGVINNKFDNYCLEQVQASNAKIIELPEVFEPKRGDRVLAWYNDESTAKERIFLTEIKGAICPFIVVNVNYESLFEKDEKFDVLGFQNIKPIPEPQIVELTLEDISNGKGVGIAPELIRIKK